MLKKSLIEPVLCAICGKNEAATKDHIPPKGIFIKPRPSNLITVPSCLLCNQGASQLDERFKLYLGLHVGKQQITGNQFFKEGTMGTLRHNRKLRMEVIKKMQPVHIATKSGLIYDRGYSVLWDSNAHDATIERIIRGLFYHHYQSILGDNVNIKTHWFKELPYFDYETLYKVDIGEGIFSYYHNKAIDSEFESIWIFEFYQAHWAGGYTTKKK
ncbi:MAG: hypothetical protein J7604_25965 [Sporocytophaga sp.]|nr:hypothetical protein [Sporocytophaga sp.]